MTNTPQSTTAASKRIAKDESNVNVINLVASVVVAQPEVCPYPCSIFRLERIKHSTFSSDLLFQGAIMGRNVGVPTSTRSDSACGSANAFSKKLNLHIYGHKNAEYISRKSIEVVKFTKDSVTIRTSKDCNMKRGIGLVRAIKKNDNRLVDLSNNQNANSSEQKPTIIQPWTQIELFSGDVIIFDYFTRKKSVFHYMLVRKCDKVANNSVIAERYDHDKDCFVDLSSIDDSQGRANKIQQNKVISTSESPRKRSKNDNSTQSPIVDKISQNEAGKSRKLRSHCSVPETKSQNTLSEKTYSADIATTSNAAIFDDIAIDLPPKEDKVAASINSISPSPHIGEASEHLPLELTTSKNCNDSKISEQQLVAKKDRIDAVVTKDKVIISKTNKYETSTRRRLRSENNKLCDENNSISQRETSQIFLSGFESKEGTEKVRTPQIQPSLSNVLFRSLGSSEPHVGYEILKAFTMSKNKVPSTLIIRNILNAALFGPECEKVKLIDGNKHEMTINYASLICSELPQFWNWETFSEIIEAPLRSGFKFKIAHQYSATIDFVATLFEENKHILNTCAESRSILKQVINIMTKFWREHKIQCNTFQRKSYSDDPQIEAVCAMNRLMKSYCHVISVLAKHVQECDGINEADMLFICLSGLDSNEDLYTLLEDCLVSES